ncbi:MAG TPA: pyridoxal-dependent decarboxylase [Acidimicrobiales bacterium]|nr:pyridoxal-dependent decarboxylase [Acidimicrobiales bacterium]
MDPEEFRRAGHELVDWIADYRLRAATLPVRARVRPGEVLGALPASPPEEAAAFAEILHDLDAVVVPGLTHTQHPRNFAWFPSNASLSSVLGDITAAGLGALGITWQSAPALTELEQVVCDWMRQLAGLSEGWHGTILDGASAACLVALLVARERATDGSQRRSGLQGEPSPLTVYCSADAHSSVAKAALLAGYGSDHLRLLAPAGPARCMDAAKLDEAMSADRAAGRRPAAVVATAGTTGTTGFDPIGAVAEVARRHGAFLHVDAAMAGAALLLPEHRHLFEGIEEADSLCWNPHKWMGTVLETSLFYVRDPAELVGVMATDPSYLRSSVDGAVVQYRDWGIPLGRRFRALKLWYQLRLDGPEAIRRRLRRDLAHAARLGELVAAEPGWELVAPVQLQTVCVRHVPDGCGPDELDAHTLAWCEAVNASGQAHLTPSLLDKRWMVRVSIGAEPTEWDDVEATWRLMQEAAATTTPGREG